MFTLAVGIRLVGMYNPPLEYHPLRQLRSAIIARGFFYQMHPGSDPALQQSAVALAQQDTFEPSIFEGLVAVTYVVLGSEQLWVARIWATLFWMIGAIALIAILRRYVSFFAMVIPLAFFFYLPYSVMTSRSFQPDGFMVMWILLACWALVRWMEARTWRRAITAGLVGGVAILVKVTAALFLGGAFVGAVLVALGWRRFWREAQVYVMAALCLVPMILYYIVLHGGGAGSYFQFWTVGMAQMLVTSKFYLQWIVMINNLTGLTLLAVAILGTIIAAPRLRAVLLGLWFGYIVYGLTWPFQYTSHEYYHLMLVPIIALGMAPVVELVVSKLSEMKILSRLAAAGLVIAASAFYLYSVRSDLLVNDFRYEPESWRRVGQSIPTDGKFVALTGDYGVRLAYYGWRVMNVYWPSAGDLTVKDIRGDSITDWQAYFDNTTQGMSYFLVTALTELDNQPQLKTILSRYPVYFQGNGWTIYDLRQPPKAP